jgi:hypothetical protein
MVTLPDSPKEGRHPKIGLLIASQKTSETINRFMSQKRRKFLDRDKRQSYE